MNKFVIVFLIFAPISFNILSETYVCSQEMSNYGKPGEINTIQFRREGSNFVHGKLGHVYEVSEYSSIIILTSIVSIALQNALFVQWGRLILNIHWPIPCR